MTDEWSKEELRAAVDAYVEMQAKKREGHPFTKKRYYEELAARFGRSQKAFEYRMQNISYVMTLLGRNWLSGLKPARNVGARNAGEIEAMIAQAEGKKFVPVAAFEIEARGEAKRINFPQPNGNHRPASTTTQITQYHRDAAVKAWVLQKAGGKCDCCQLPAPFKGSDGEPFLEVHHVRHLAESGPDTVTNAVALCPNCHRELHYGDNSREMVALLYERVTRLVRD
jgi:5-methylcytosine-specific restriction protein A